MSFASAPWRAASAGLAILAAVAVLGCAEEPPVEPPAAAASPDDPPPLEALPAEPVESAPLDSPPVSEMMDPAAEPTEDIVALAEGDALPPDEPFAGPMGEPLAGPLADPLDDTQAMAAAPPDLPPDPQPEPAVVSPYLPVPALLLASEPAGLDAEAEEAPAPFQRRPLDLPADLPREELPALGALNLPEEPAAPAAPPPPQAEGTPPPVQIVAPVQRVRQGPWRVVCYQEGEVVFEHNSIYRVWLADHVPPQWAYETVDGIRFRGRIGSDVNCQWIRQ